MCTYWEYIKLERISVCFGPLSRVITVAAIHSRPVALIIPVAGITWPLRFSHGKEHACGKVTTCHGGVINAARFPRPGPSFHAIPEHVARAGGAVWLSKAAE